MTRGRGQRGIRRAREALELLDGRSASRPESRLRCVLVAGGLPAPEVNATVLDRHGGWLAQPDLLYRRARLGIEYNGRDHSDVPRMRRDITRTLDLEREGWHVVVFGPAEVFRRPDSVLAHVRALLDARDPGWRRRPAA